MNCDDIRQRLAEHWEGLLVESERAEVESHLAACAECTAEANSLGEVWNMLGELPQDQPTDALRSRFDAMLSAYQQGLSDARTEPSGPRAMGARFWPRRSVWQLATAAALVVVGWAGGVFLTGPGSGLTGQSAGPDEIAELRGEISSMRQLLTLSLLRQESASQRLRAMSWSRQLEAPEDEVMSALLTAVETDPNVNVRLAALDAVRRFAGQTNVKRRLVEMLGEPSSPLVRIGLIDVLADLRDEESTSAIRRLVEEDELDPAVRQKALLVLDY